MRLRNHTGKLSKSNRVRGEEVILDFGREKYTLNAFASKFGIPNNRGARNLGKVIGVLRPRSILELANRTTPDDIWSLDGIREVGMFVWLRAIDVASGDSTEWFDRNVPAGRSASFSANYDRVKRKRKEKKRKK